MKNLSIRSLALIAILGVALACAVAYLMQEDEIRVSSKPMASKSQIPPGAGASSGSGFIGTSTRPISTSALPVPGSMQVTEPRKSSTFEREADLFRLAFQAMSSGNPSVLVNGFDAAQTCITITVDWDLIEPLLQELQTQSAEQRARTLAAKEIVLRCRGFINNDRAGNSSIRNAIKVQARTNPAIYLGSTDAQPLTPAQFVDALDRLEWTTLRHAASEIIPKAVAAQRPSLTGQEAMNFAAAYSLSMCDIGADCSANSLPYLFGCARFGRCTGSMELYLSREMDEATLSRVNGLRQRIASAWRARDESFFGFKR